MIATSLSSFAGKVEHASNFALTRLSVLTYGVLSEMLGMDRLEGWRGNFDGPNELAYHVGIDRDGGFQPWGVGGDRTRED
jgi:hypothetical protein